MRLKRALLLIFFLLAGALFGALLASACVGSESFAWLAFSREIGISPDAPFVLDLSMMRFSFGFSVELSIAQVLVMGLAIFIYSLVTKDR